MKLDPSRTHAASIAGLFLCGLLAAGVAIAALQREPVVRRDTRCYFPPEAPEPTEAELRMEYVEVIARLREIREKFARLHAGELFEAPDEASGPAHEVDRLLVELIADCHLKSPRPEGRP